MFLHIYFYLAVFVLEERISEAKEPLFSINFDEIQIKFYISVYKLKYISILVTFLPLNLHVIFQECVDRY
jgi:hypothetical protein